MDLFRLQWSQEISCRSIDSNIQVMGLILRNTQTGKKMMMDNGRNVFCFVRLHSWCYTWCLFSNLTNKVHLTTTSIHREQVFWWLQKQGSLRHKYTPGMMSFPKMVEKNFSLDEREMIDFLESWMTWPQLLFNHIFLSCQSQKQTWTTHHKSNGKVYTEVFWPKHFQTSGWNQYNYADNYIFKIFMVRSQM